MIKVNRFRKLLCEDAIAAVASEFFPLGFHEMELVRGVTSINRKKKEVICIQRNVMVKLSLGK